MNREQAISVLRSHEQELKAAGVLAISLFGSTARGDNGPDSDVDLAVRLAEDFSNGGLDYFGRMDDLGNRLSRILSCRVHLTEEPVRKLRLQMEIDRDRALAF